jgi:hypothetical protein
VSRYKPQTRRGVKKAPPDGNYRVEDQKFKIYDRGTSTYRTIQLSNGVLEVE